MQPVLSDATDVRRAARPAGDHHGIRFGYLIANPALTNTIGKALPKWNINSLAEAVIHMLADHDADYRDSLRRLARDRRQMYEALGRVPDLTVFPSQGNFLLSKLPAGWGGVELRDFLISQHGVYVRECGNKLGMTSQFLRLVVRPPEDVERLITGLLDYGRRQEGTFDLRYLPQDSGGFRSYPAVPANGATFQPAVPAVPAAPNPA